MDIIGGDATSRRMRFVLACWLVGCVVAFAETPATGASAEIWPPVGVAFVGLTLVWDGRSRLGRPALTMLAVMAVSFAAIAAAFGQPLLDSVAMAVLNLGASLVMALVYIRAKMSPGWMPQDARALGSLAGAAVFSSTMLSLLGGFPGHPWGELEPLTAWWTIRSSIFAFIAGASFLIFYFGDRERWRTRAGASLAQLTLLIPVSFASVWILLLDPSLSLGWLLLIPTVWAGVILTPYGAAVHAVLQALCAGTFAFVGGTRYALDGVVPSSLIVDLLLMTCTFMTLHIALLRDERERAIDAEQRLRHDADAQATLLGQVFDSMSDAIMLFDADGRLLRHNPAARQLFGRPLPPPRSESWSSYLELSHLDGRPLEDAQLPGSPGLERHDLSAAMHQDADRRILELGSWPLPQSDVLVLVTDVTNHQHRFAELSRFAGIVSHDLRTPLTSLNGWLELAHDALRRRDVDALEPLIARAESSTRRMESVIGGWINYTVVREGQLSPQRAELGELLDEVTESTALPRGGPGPKVSVDAPHVVRADPDLLRQLMANLVGNAVKFAPPGACADVEITSRHDDEAGWIRIEVADRGIGLPVGEEQQIFEEFHRAPEHTNVEGTGLGLSVCRQIVTRHGGSIAAFTNHHGGATVTLTLPAAE